MVAIAPIPANEAIRLAVLQGYQILDTGIDERFELFVRLATWLFDVPMSAINLVDSDRTFFKSLIGLAAYEPDRRVSICAHAVGIGEDLLVIDDLAKDNRFLDHPLLVKKGVRFYAGALLRSDCGHDLGTLCIADTKPRAFPQDDRQKLIELAKGAGAILELHRRGLWLMRAATQDVLTGLHNRRAFEAILEATLSRSDRDRRCALFCLDLDRFKTVNDTLGHAAGDAMLAEVGRRLSRLARPTDCVARLGGDEFALLRTEATSLQDAENTANLIRAAFAEPFQFDGWPIRIRGSIGIALCPLHAADPVALMRHADKALYRAKDLGRGRTERPMPASCAG